MSKSNCDECDITPCVQCGMCVCSLITPHYSCGVCDWLWLEDSLPGVHRINQNEIPKGQQTFEVEVKDMISKIENSREYREGVVYRVIYEDEEE